MSDDTHNILGDNAGVHIPQGDASADVSLGFGDFIVGLYHSAMMALGKMEHPELGTQEPDPDSARHTIDILRMLEVKTKGNLEEDEERLMQHLLYELKVAFVEVNR